MRTRLRAVTLLHKKTRYRVYVHSVPSKKHLLRLVLKGATEPVTLKVKSVLYDIAENGQANMVELQLHRPRRKLAPTEDLVPRFHADLDWPTGTCPPCIWDSVQLRHGESLEPLELKVLKVIHDIDQVAKTHSIKVQVIDASPKRVFSDEDIERAMKPPEQSYEPIEVPW